MKLDTDTMLYNRAIRSASAAFLAALQAMVPAHNQWVGK